MKSHNELAFIHRHRHLPMIWTFIDSKAVANGSKRCSKGAHKYSEYHQNTTRELQSELQESQLESQSKYHRKILQIRWTLAELRDTEGWHSDRDIQPIAYAKLRKRENLKSPQVAGLFHSLSCRQKPKTNKCNAAKAPPHWESAIKSRWIALVNLIGGSHWWIT